MSLHSYHTMTREGMPVVVHTGWDDQLKGFSLFIAPAEGAGADGDGTHLFSNLDHMPGLPLEKGYVALHSHLSRFGIELPPAMLSAVLKDTHKGTRNMRVLWHSDGTVSDVRSW